MPPEVTLEAVARRGVLRVGFQRHTPPFSYATGAAFAPMGYSVDLAGEVVDALSRTVGCALSIESVEVTSSTREGLLLAGNIDVECGSTTITDERRQRVAFSRPIFRTSHRIAVKRSCVTTKGAVMRLTGISGSTSHAALVAHAPSSLRFEFMGRASIGEAFDHYCRDPSIDGIVADEVILASLVACAGDEASTVLEARLGEEDYGFMLRQADVALLAAVDECLGSRLQDPDRLACLSAWFSGPLPDLGVALGLDVAMRGAVPSPLRRTVPA